MSIGFEFEKVLARGVTAFALIGWRCRLGTRAALVKLLAAGVLGRGGAGAVLATGTTGVVRTNGTYCPTVFLLRRFFLTAFFAYATFVALEVSGHGVKAWTSRKASAQHSRDLRRDLSIRSSPRLIVVNGSSR